ncbi:ATP-grasp domain-containing protein [Chloroflexota bacterium]
MVKLFEFEGKSLFREYDIRVPIGMVVRSPDLSDEDLNGPKVVKAQVLTGGRGKAGGIILTESSEDTFQAIRSLLGGTVLGHRVGRVLVEERLKIQSEFYLSIVLDRRTSCPLLVFTQQGGVDVEEIPDHLISKVPINPLIGLQPFMCRNALQRLDASRSVVSQMENLITRLYALFAACHCELVEVNPVAVTVHDEVICADSKIVIADSGWDTVKHRFEGIDRQDQTAFERAAAGLGIQGIELGGEIVVIAAGAGCALATADVVANEGGNLAAVMDLGGIVVHDFSLASQAMAVANMLTPKVILCNFFMQVADCGTLARAILSAYGEEKAAKIVARMKGNQSETGTQILADAGCLVTDSFEEACSLATAIARRG